MKLAKTYEPGQYEPTTYALWEASNAFAPSPDLTKGTFSVVMPPPNANGNLHMGHALTTGLQDIMVRYQRMLGKSVAFIPGADHAGFETWVVFEKELEKQGRSRFDFSREELYAMVWDFVHKHRGNMELQNRQLGASADWNNLTFTLDKKVIDRAYKTFKKLWDDGLVYRGKRLVNYCTKHHTAFADIEVLYEDRKTPLYYLKYGPFELATTRPETKFGDTAVAVHPDDARYKALIGQKITVEGVNGPFTLSVVADEYVDPTFGTGVVKITPAHDFNDWEVGERHNLPVVQVIDLDGKLNEKAGRFAGMTVLEGRQAVVEALKQKDLITKVDENYQHRVGVCYKCKTVIEPMLLDQWFISVAPLAKQAIVALQANEISFTPKNKGQVLQQYLENLRDWNISRQIPWGIPIPAFQNVQDPADWIFDTRVESKEITVNGKTYRRDEDTFDTWFSSGQWPFVTTDYLDGGALAPYYPLSVMETGGDILYSWVARMVLLGLYCTEQVPFKHVYLHGMVLDEHGQKMSKSKGNVLSPVELMDQYGSDALRMGLIAGRGADVGQAFSPATVVAGRNFCNKLWNMARFIESTVAQEFTTRAPQPISLADHWVLHRLETAASQIAKLIEQYRFAEAYEAMYHVIWDDVADWYLEAAKVQPNNPMLAYVLEVILKLAHPFAPFVTETIWQTLQWEKGLLLHAEWPQSSGQVDVTLAQEFESLQAIITEARFVSSQLGAAKQTLLFSDDTLIEANQDLLIKLAKLKEVIQTPQAQGVRLALANHEAWLQIDAEALARHNAQLKNRLADCQQQITLLQKRLQNKAYTENAPASVVAQTKQQLEDQQKLAERLQRELAQ